MDSPAWRKCCLGRNSLIIPCKFPGRLRIPCIHAGFIDGIFLAGIFSLINSLRREFRTQELVFASKLRGFVPGLKLEAGSLHSNARNLNPEVVRPFKLSGSSGWDRYQVGSVSFGWTSQEIRTVEAVSSSSASLTRCPASITMPLSSMRSSTSMRASDLCVLCTRTRFLRTGIKAMFLGRFLSVGCWMSECRAYDGAACRFSGEIPKSAELLMMVR